MPPPAPTPPRRAFRGLTATAALVALVLVLGACGDDSGSASNPASAQRPGAGRGLFAQTPAVRACLQKQGVALPAGGGRRFRGGAGTPSGDAPRTGTNATPPSGTNATPPSGTNATPPSGAGGGPGFARRDPAQFAKLQAALKKCGVTPPARGQGAPRQAAPTSTTPSTTAS
jgi:hypothetical protein